MAYYAIEYENIVNLWSFLTFLEDLALFIL